MKAIDVISGEKEVQSVLYLGDGGEKERYFISPLSLFFQFLFIYYVVYFISFKC